MARTGSGYVNLDTYLRPNMAAGQDMANHVAGETARQGDAERAALQSLQAGEMAPTDLEAQAQATGARARLAAPSGGGLASVMATDYGQTGPYTSGMGGFDAFLAGAAGGKTLQASANKYGGLGNEVNQFNQKAAAYTPPTAPAQTSPQASAAPSFFSPLQSRRTPAPYSPLTYSPEQTEGMPPPKRRNQQIDPGMSGGMGRRKAGGM